ncbi:uncharacterized protein NDAI_0H00740 [Naumovozyma dairenensis CBS 421]|uniref:Uncharacterized protein n=1 Tax=Naumovozyma dairenensis (strain ATCC 10597 / BCRC 20456 / CBS 421 / NBRC 0211 / NRRL Y-12639) TaxID=1071378 RepID=G0WEN7_NAUDC|nr:hypothetical protein NDAI_0H00740 [Naumovozyma dairenensis CBS 421]CCD26248.1 hypothetical protein NDAI_0H00740 [Naumovozyma dairenensis CBS 421]
MFHSTIPDSVELSKKFGLSRFSLNTNKNETNTNTPILNNTTNNNMEEEPRVLLPVIQEHTYVESSPISLTSPSLYAHSKNQTKGLSKFQFKFPSTASSTGFVNTPTRYTYRARDEIKKRLSSKITTTDEKIHKDNDQIPRMRNSFEREPYYKQSSSDSYTLYSDNASSYQSSVFSMPSAVTSSASSYRQEQGAYTNHIPTRKFIKQVTIEEAIPPFFQDMYFPEILISESTSGTLLYNGRPSFTKRELLDWDLNDIRSLLIVEKLRYEWGNQLPEIITRNHDKTDTNTGSSAAAIPKFKFTLLPLDSSDEFIINTLANSDLYLEADLDYEFKLTSAKYTVMAARRRHEQLLMNNANNNSPQTQLNSNHQQANMNMELSKPEWRNIIENYLLNIAVEAQCRFDFKERCSEFKKWKLQHQLEQQAEELTRQQQQQQQQQAYNAKKNNSNNGLLKRALWKNFNKKESAVVATNDDEQNNECVKNLELEQLSSHSAATRVKVSLTKEEKSIIWSQCQAQVYQRLGLDWQPDGLS